MSSRTPLRLPWLLLLATLLGAFAAVIAKGGSVIFARLLSTPAPKGSWLYITLASTFDWSTWALLTPSIFRLSARFPIIGPRRWRALAVHVGAALVFVAVHAFLAAIGWRLVDLWYGYPSRILNIGLQTILRTSDWSLAFYGGLVAVAHALRYRDEAQARALTTAHLETKLAEAQLEVLQRQLHPHFLFNTLHAIYTLVGEDPRAAQATIDRLSEMLRVTLAQTSAQQVPLDTELTFLDKYLAIQQVLLGDRLAVRVDVPLAVRDARVPYLMLQPLAENAIRHGIEPLARAGVITISARRAGDALELAVADNGRGIAPGRLAAFNQNQGVGLANTRARLERLYPGKHALHFLETPGGGLTVVLRIPYASMEQEAA
jgi:two-component system, LytTR family, sensor kinase